MAHIIAYGPTRTIEIECHNLAAAKRLASELMRDSSDYGKVDIFETGGKYITTAWGE